MKFCPHCGKPPSMDEINAALERLDRTETRTSTLREQLENARRRSTYTAILALVAWAGALIILLYQSI